MQQTAEHSQHHTFQVDLGFFSGPLDLLLHLVRRQEVPIAEVDMALICEHYLQIVLNAVDIDLEVAAEFLVIAATLLAIKSESLLPNAKYLGTDGEELAEDSPFYEELRERLRRYEQFKKSAMNLRARPQLGLETFARRPERHEAPEDSELVIDESPNVLAKYCIALLRRIGQSAQLFRVQLESVSVVGYMMQIVDRMQQSVSAIAGENSFLKIVRNFLPNKSEAKDVTARGALIGSFLAVLELCKRGVLAASQEDSDRDIRLALCIDVDSNNLIFDEQEVEQDFGMLVESGG